MAKPTLKDVAAASGFSLATAAFILRGHPKSFPEATRTAVLAAALRLGYRANASARAVRSGRMGAIALVQIEEDLHGDMAWSTLDGVVAEVERGGDHLIFTKLPAAAFADPAAMPKILQQLVVDGLLLSYHTGAPAGLADALRALQVPSVWINSRLPADCVHLDDLAAAHLVVSNLVRLGHRRIAYVNPWQPPGAGTAPQHYSMIDRLQGYREAMRAAGCRPVELTSRNDPRGDGMYQDLLAGPQRPTALVLYHAHFAPPFLIAAARLGLAVPGDLSLVTFSDRIDTVGGMALTAVRGAYARMGAAAVVQLRQHIAAPSHALPPRSVTGDWFAGESLGPCSDGET
ncbi:MAG: LacI family DNA-binding transcriptional regulator [Planctomycetes bacterium]|nr:LacI family DNA-binding transcriptional regulator [Planctomycetota bacterium]